MACFACIRGLFSRNKTWNGVLCAGKITSLLGNRTGRAFRCCGWLNRLSSLPNILGKSRWLLLEICLFKMLAQGFCRLEVLYRFSYRNKINVTPAAFLKPFITTSIFLSPLHIFGQEICAIPEFKHLFCRQLLQWLLASSDHSADLSSRAGPQGQLAMAPPQPISSSSLIKHLAYSGELVYT